MRANDYLKTIEPNCDFYDILKKLIYEFAYYRNDKEGTERVYNFYLLQDKTRKKYLDELKMWELLEQDKNHKPTYYENTFGITHNIASHIRDLLFSTIENDKSFGYLFYLLASEKNRTEIFYQNNPIDCIPDKKLIEETIYNYQDDYPKKSLEEFLTYCDFNYLFYKKYKTDSHTNDYWFSIFYKSYSIFEDVRTLLFYPFSAFEFIKELDFNDEYMKLYCITLVLQLLEHYNYDLTHEQVRGKKILVDEIQNYLDSLKSGEIPADPIVRAVGWLSKHPELMTKGEQQDILNTFKLLKDFGNEINTIFPPFELVKSKIDETSEIDEKIKILEDVIATWEVNKNIAIKHRNDDTAEEIGDKNISLFTDLLNYWKKMKELHSKTNSQNIISEKMNEISFESDSMDNTNQIVSKLKAINDNLLETTQILNQYLQGGILPPSEVEKLKELKQMFGYESYKEIIAPIENNKQLVTNITNAVFVDLWEFAIDFLDLYNLKENDKKFNEYKVKIIQIGNEIDFYLDAFECLRYNLNNLHIFYTSHGIPFTGKWSIEKYGINLDYNDLLLEALNEYDLTKRKEFILKKLHTAELFKLQDTVDKEDFDEFDDFIDKCYKVVESIDFQIKNTTTTVSPNKKPRTILDEKREMNEAFNSPEAIAAMEEASRNMYRKLTDKDIELVTNDCNTLNEVYVKGLDIFESYFSTNQINSEDIEYLETLPFSGLLSDNYFEVSVLSNFDDAVVIGTIFDICFGDTIFRIQNLDFTFCSIPELNNEPRLKELIRTILKNNKNSVLIKDNLLSFAKQIRELIELVYAYTDNPEYIKKVNLNVFKSDSFFTELETNSNAVELPENYINNGGIITTGNIDTSEIIRYFRSKNANKELYLVDKLEINLA